MGKEIFKPGNMLYPLPAVMVTCMDEHKKANIITLAWAGTICTNPPMVSISVRPERYSHDIIKNSGEFVINLVNEDLTYACDYCGVRSGRDVDKFEIMKLTKGKGSVIETPIIEESPVSIECKVRQVMELGSHNMFIADVVGVVVDDTLLDETGKFHLNSSKLVAYSHGCYFSLGEQLGTFGYSVKKKDKACRKK